jgi:PD-(D/E)XK nuclease superfamily
MSVWTHYQDITVAPPSEPAIRPRFSLTADIISFRRCSRQYGHFGNDGYVPAQAVQVFFGTIIHQVLDRCHRHYSGLMGAPKGSFPTNADVEAYFGEVENALKSQGIRPASGAVRDRALLVLKTFNRIEGPTLYPRVFDTEYRLEADRGDYVLRGVVDVLAAAGDATPDHDNVEIWDYKGTRFPDLSSPTMRDYEWQMAVYAELYRSRTGRYPKRAILYFLNELDEAMTKRPLRAVHEVHFDKSQIAKALNEFASTATDIMGCRAARAWPLPGQAPSKETCDICDLRWNCSAAAAKYDLRTPLL